MIPVALQPEPADFDTQVRQPGLAWLNSHNVVMNGPPPNAPKLPAYWSKSNKALWDAYCGTCSYLAIFFEWVTGASSTDHFVAKSKSAGGAYEWNNYRLSCLAPNRNKNKFDDLLDPVGLAQDTFILNLVSGKIRPNSSLSQTQKKLARKTIKRLRLDSPEHAEMRLRHYNRYLRNKDRQTLRELSPFVWYEAQRQGLL
ncbi:MAG: hypothetical protein ABSG51_00360 [Terracidiphilus sp.]